MVEAAATPLPPSALAATEAGAPATVTRAQAATQTATQTARATHWQAAVNLNLRLGERPSRTGIRIGPACRPGRKLACGGGVPDTAPLGLLRDDLRPGCIVMGGTCRPSLQAQRSSPRAEDSDVREWPAALPCGPRPHIRVLGRDRSRLQYWDDNTSCLSLSFRPPSTSHGPGPGPPDSDSDTAGPGAAAPPAQSVGVVVGIQVSGTAVAAPWRAPGPARAPVTVALAWSRTAGSAERRDPGLGRRDRPGPDVDCAPWKLEKS